MLQKYSGGRRRWRVEKMNGEKKCAMRNIVAQACREHFTFEAKRIPSRGSGTLLRHIRSVSLRRIGMHADRKTKKQCCTELQGKFC